ncbi:NAD dependent epimerase/dehydratase family protein [Aspergillus sclerotioniger CBS 115572]|uniref:NAD dependent epimerase/dehydratase family protein n=1 Tax=Aspergillus sclerotioniger CBS 115572 TaxID=1450535 RepID=A0A317WYN4_9EURO|nr:NAD dependent epimerase/dehydratase family protein [Aspergillus sclerotioniger CBS 115572]PWY90377.1 NAD dependent epimerase/dehydratase family protein [Aspergillus sclerotioniger CBS 115572]
MSHNILLTGTSGYLGGTLLAHLSTPSNPSLPPYKTLYALTRTPSQSHSVEQYGAVPLPLDLTDTPTLIQTIIDKKITIIYFLIDATSSKIQVPMIEALGKVKEITGQEVHFLHTTGAKLFSGHAGHPTEGSFGDGNGEEVYEMQGLAGGRVGNPFIKEALKVNSTIINTAEKHGVKSYIFIPCIVYGKGEGFGNRISIQTVAVVKAAMRTRRVFRVDDGAGRAVWPVSHIQDTVSLYLELLRNMLQGTDALGHGKNGYYLAASGSVAWDDLYAAMGKRLAERGVVDDATVVDADDEALEKIGEALGRPKDFVRVEMGGSCVMEAKHGLQIGWKPKYAPEHALEVAGEEVDWILENLERD